VEHRGPDGPLTGGRAAVRRPGDGEKWQRPKARSGEGIIDSDERREGWEWLWLSEVRPGRSFIGIGGRGGGRTKAVVRRH
jgi:hypothetical protein